MVDLDVYQYTGHVVLDGGNILTARVPAADPANRLAFIYPPFAALLCIPLVIVPHTLLQALMTTASALAVLAVLYRLGLRGWTASLVSAGCLLLVEPVRETIGFGQVNLLLMALVVLDLAPGRRLVAGKRWLPTGALTGLAAAIKVTPALFAVYLLVARQRREAAGVVLTVAVLTLGAGVLMPAESAGFVRLLLEGDTRTGPAHYLFNQSILGAALRVAGESEVSRYAGLALSAVVALLGAYVAALWHRRGEALLAVVLCGTATTLASPLSWTHHFVWVVPLAVVLVRGTSLPRGLRIAGLAFAVWVSAAPFRLLPAAHGLELTYNVFQQAVSVLTPALGITLIVVALILGARPLPGSPAAGERTHPDTAARPR